MTLRVTAWLALAILTAPLAAQDTGLALARPVALHLNRVPLDAALGVVEQAASVRLLYDPQTMPARTISLDTARITVGEALQFMLRGLDIRVLVRDGNEVLLVPMTPDERLRLVRGATIGGRVTNAQDGTPVTDATIDAGADHHTRSGIDGQYALRGLPPGSYSVTVRALGFTATTRAVVVDRDTVVQADFALTPAPAVLDRVVTTATGDQRLAALGNSIATIAVADSVVGRAPVTTLSDVLTARASGVQVFVPGGLTGASPAISIRGQNSANLSNQPLLVIDGVRVDNTPASDIPILGAFVSGELTGRFDDLVPEEIASIEIVKGPSAATLYGTDAANGVIVVTTKRGLVGRPQWTVFAENGLLTFERDRFPETFFPWGHPVGGPTPPTPLQCPLSQIGEGICVQDSVTSFNPIRVDSLTPIGVGHQANYGLQVSGGTPTTRYFTSGTLESETGYLKMPEHDLSALRVARGALGVASDEIHPNGVDKASGRTNLTTSVGRDADVALSLGLLTQSARVPGTFTLVGAAEGQGYPNAPNEGWGIQQRPSQFFVIRNEQEATHFTGSVAPQWRPASWLALRATGGIDYASESLDHLERPGEGFANPLGYREIDRTESGTYTADAGATATVPLFGGLSSRSSIGAQYTHRALLLTQAIGQVLATGSTTLAGAAVQSSGEETDESIIAGGYAEQTMSLNDRLFLTGALRADGASTFGNGFKSALYPKASASWLVSQEPFWPRVPALTSVRLRAAYGASGVQPPPGAALVREGLFPVVVDGVPTSGTNLRQLANPELEPERQQEFEGGVDVDAWHERVHVEATYYNKRSTDAIVPIPLSASLGNTAIFQQYENIGAVRNWGYEGLVRVTVIDTRPLEADVAVNGSINHNQLVSLGAGATTPAQAISQNNGQPVNVLGFPLSSYFDLPITSYTDANHDGIIEPNEITLGGPRFAGQAYPKSQYTTTAGLSLFGRQLRVAAQFDYRGGFVIFDQVLWSQCFDEQCPDAFRRGTPLRRQAQATNAQDFFTDGQSLSGFIEDGSFTRLRELSVTWTAPAWIARAARARTATVTLAGRNLALWTHYRGIDPEAQAFLSPTGATSGYSAPPAPIPPATYWIARVTLGI
jgi:TonB-dependent SusC/RagA subfamily outer membrane receptor